MKKYWFYIESYVYISQKKDKVLLYNTLDGKLLEFNDKETLKIITRLKKSSNHQIINLIESEIKQPKIKKFISILKQHYMGDLYDSSLTKMKPIQLLPYLKIHNDVKFLLKNENELIGNHILENLYEITIYLANTCDTECDICNDGYKQFICCNKRFNNSDIDLNELWHTFYQLKNQPVNINIIGNIKSINDILDRYNPNDFSFMSFSWYTHVLNIPDNFELIKRFNNLNVSVIISNPSDEKCVDKLKFILKNDFKLKFYFIIQSDDSLNQANDLIHKLNISDYVFQPFYNGSNYDFFMSNVFNSKKDIQNHKVSFKDILINEKININYFGRLIITNTGDIFTSFYNKKIGSIKDDIKSVILKELKENTNWRTLRRDYIPCKSCTYNLLCPPISNIEKALKKNNLCTIL